VVVSLSVDDDYSSSLMHQMLQQVHQQQQMQKQLR
jgi:hypothetical protein